jgi:hypothetical protein
MVILSLYIALISGRKSAHQSFMVHCFDHLTLNPSPEGEGLYSIPVGMVALF